MGYLLKSEDILERDWDSAKKNSSTHTCTQCFWQIHQLQLFTHRSHFVSHTCLSYSKNLYHASILILKITQGNVHIFYQFHAFLIFFNISKALMSCFSDFSVYKAKNKSHLSILSHQMKQTCKVSWESGANSWKYLVGWGGRVPVWKAWGVAARVWYFFKCSASEGPQSEQPRYLLGYQAKKTKNWYLLHLEKEIFKPCTKKQYPGTFSFFSTCPLSSKKCMK